MMCLLVVGCCPPHQETFSLDNTEPWALTDTQCGGLAGWVSTAGGCEDWEGRLHSEGTVRHWHTAQCYQSPRTHYQHYPHITSHHIRHHITLHYITSHNITSHHITLHYITLHHITSLHITSHHITSYHITSHHITSHHITSHHITSHYITSHHITSHYITSHHGYNYWFWVNFFGPFRALVTWLFRSLKKSKIRKMTFVLSEHFCRASLNAKEHWSLVE